MTRYAVYGVPGVDPAAPAQARRLRAAAEEWFAQHPQITVHPRRYGFHATLKAPFALAESTTAAELERAVTAFAAQRDAVVLPAVRPVVIGSFRALAPSGDLAQVTEFAAEVVRAFEPFRAPLSDADIARRRPETLTPRQREILDEVGYPYSLDEYRLHLTLTDALAGESRDDAASDGDGASDGPGAAPASAGDVDAAIRAHFAKFDGVDIPLTALALFIEPASGQPFRIRSIHPFRSIHPLRETA